MSDFFDKLVEDRRRGVALDATAPPHAEREADLQVNFYPAPFDGLSTCGRCCALLVTEYTPTHADWHRQQGH